jgi:hypothetical protein
MPTLFVALLSFFKTRASLQAEILALRDQLLVLQRCTRSRRLRLRMSDRILWVWFIAAVARLASVTSDHQTGDGHRLESERVPLVLDVEESDPKGPTVRAARDLATD